MNWLVWNVGGANKRYKQKELRKYLREKHITLAGLTETRVKEHKAHNVANVVAPNWGLQNNYHSASNGRIWMLWDTSIYILDKLREDTQLLHYQITMKATGITCVLTVIYGYNICEQMRTLWDALKEITQGVTIPWLICGYFNVVLYPRDRLFENHVQYATTRDFTKCMLDLLLNEVC